MLALAALGFFAKQGTSRSRYAWPLMSLFMTIGRDYVIDCFCGFQLFLQVVRSRFAHARLEVRGVELLKRRLIRIALTLATFAALVSAVAADGKWK
ncbi:MAG TPA: hypothetical protein VFA45_24915 [Actinomycetes bacterium]|nr:hypothetical protein [Actinomycetes bacterium]